MPRSADEMIFSPARTALLRELYPHHGAAVIIPALNALPGQPITDMKIVSSHAGKSGMHKTPQYMAENRGDAARLRVARAERRLARLAAESAIEISLPIPPRIVYTPPPVAVPRPALPTRRYPRETPFRMGLTP